MKLMRSIPLMRDKSLINCDDNFIFSLILISTFLFSVVLINEIFEPPISKLFNKGTILFKKSLVLDCINTVSYTHLRAHET